MAKKKATKKKTSTKKTSTKAQSKNSMSMRNFIQTHVPTKVRYAFEIHLKTNEDMNDYRVTKKTSEWKVIFEKFMKRPC